MRQLLLISIIAFFLAPAGVAAARDEVGPSTEKLQEAAQNPIADLVSIPFQNNIYFGVGERDKTQYVLNVQPVYPLALSDDWNLVLRPIVPIIDQPKLFDSAGSTRAFGLGDINLQTYLTPSSTLETPLGGLNWGIGPSIIFPSATDDQLGAEKVSAGPGFVFFVSNSPFTFGSLVNNVWSFAGKKDRRDVSKLLLQPFVNYNLAGGWSVGAAPVITADWEARSGDVWTLPLGAELGKLLKIGDQAVQTNLKAYYNVVKPSHGADWQLTFQFSLLFPK